MNPMKGEGQPSIDFGLPCGREMNAESLLKHVLTTRGLVVKRFPRVMFIIRDYESDEIGKHGKMAGDKVTVPSESGQERIIVVAKQYEEYKAARDSVEGLQQCTAGVVDA